MPRNHWLDLFTGTTWDEFRKAGGTVTGFRDSRWKTVQKIRPGDYLLCYLTGVSRFIGILEVTGEPFKDSAPIWKDEAFQLWLDEWASLYEPRSSSWQLIHEVYGSYYLMNVVENDFVGGDIFAVFEDVMQAVDARAAS